jgi:hypothetical protein
MAKYNNMENQFTEQDMIDFARYSKNYTSPKDPKKALNQFLLTKRYGNRIVCQTGDQFARVKPNGEIHSIYEMCWSYRPNESGTGGGRYLPTAYNILTHYVRTPQKTASTYAAIVNDWNIKMFLQAVRYIAGDSADWKDTLYRVLAWNDGQPILDRDNPINILP